MIKPGGVLTAIYEKRKTDKTYVSGGDPHTYVELFGGKIVLSSANVPDAVSFRGDYYYNSSDNNLYVKKAEWVDMKSQFDDQDNEFIHINNRRIKKFINTPDPKNFGDIYYYNMKNNMIYGKVLAWVKSTNL